MFLEVEVKAHCSDPEKVRQALAAMGGKLVSRRQDRDRYFNHPLRDFAQTDEAFRIRSIDDTHFITYKGPKLSTRSKARMEEEVGVADGEVMFRILNSLGFTEVLLVEKKREVWKVGEVEVCLDEIEGLGSFVELELQAVEREEAEDRLFELAEKLGLDKFETRSYLEMLLEKGA